MKRTTGEIAERQLAKIRRMLSDARLPLLRMREDRVIQALRKTREELWEAKVALRSR